MRNWRSAFDGGAVAFLAVAAFREHLEFAAIAIMGWIIGTSVLEVFDRKRREPPAP